MIPDGHTPIDTSGIAALHGLSARQAARRRPWAEPNHPAPLTRGNPTNGRPRLWDHDQAAAYARGDTIPELPHGELPGDLLDRFEAAEYVTVDPVAWERDSYRDRTPPADAHPYGVPHWTCATLVAHIADKNRPPEPSGGRPSGSPESVPRGQLPARVAELVAEQGESVSVSAIAARLGVHYSTAHRHVKRLREAAEDTGET